MNSKDAGDGDPRSKTPKPLDLKSLTQQIGDVKLRLQEIEKEIKSLNLKVPDKDFYTAQKNEDLARLNDVKFRRENQFKDKRIVDSELREVNQQVQTKYDAVGKLKSTLKYKSAERVDEVIRKLESQLKRLQMKRNEERRIRQEISILKESKAKIQDFLTGEEEIKQLKEKQKNIRERRDENVRHITAVKQEESAARSLYEQHKRAADEDWTIYKENLAKRDHLRNEKDQLLKQKKELTGKYRKERSSRRDFHSKRESLSGLQAFLFSEHDSKPKDLNPGNTRTRTERKSPYEDEITLCKVLLAYLDKQKSQATSVESSSVETKESGSLHEVKENELRGTEHRLVADDDIYRGIRRKPNKRERRRKQHVGEATRKLEHHFSVVKQFLTLGIQPPATVAEVPAAERAIREKKFLRECQSKSMDALRMERAKSTPYLASFPLESKDINKKAQVESGNISDAENVSKDDMLKERQSLALNLPRKHKSCPSLPGAVQLAELASPYPSPSNITSASNSEYELDSPTSMASSTSIADVKSFAGDEKRRSLIVDDGLDFADSSVDNDTTRHFKGQHRVHFANEITEVEINGESALGIGLEGVGEKLDTVTNINGGAFYSQGMPDSELEANASNQEVKHGSRGDAMAMKAAPIRPLMRHGFDGIIHKQNYEANTQQQHVNTYEGTDEEESEVRDYNTANDFSNELQFEMDDLPSRYHKQRADNSHSKAEHNGSDWSSEEFSDEPEVLNRLPFGMDGVADNTGQKFSENLALYQRSPGSCSPRRSHEYSYVDKEDSVEVST